MIEQSTKDAQVNSEENKKDKDGQTRLHNDVITEGEKDAESSKIEAEKNTGDDQNLLRDNEQRKSEDTIGIP